ncbi:MAG: hypothetical protein WA667_10180 [Candidatus Nitrosopolaris sp.]
MSKVSPITSDNSLVSIGSWVAFDMEWEPETSRNTLEVSKDGMRPREIYDKLGSEGITGEDLKKQRSNILVENNLKSEYITRNENTGRVKMTYFLYLYFLLCLSICLQTILLSNRS